MASGNASLALQVIDSHTAGEPTRTVVGGLPDLGGGTVAEQLKRLRDQADWVRTSLILEPRGSDVMVGAVLVPPSMPDSAAGVIFFNNVGYLHMCGHGLIGVAATLRWMGRLSGGRHTVETPVGKVDIDLLEDGRVRFENVPSYRWRRDVGLTLASGRRVTGDIAWGGNWFFLCHDHGETIARERIDALLELTTQIREAIDREQMRGQDGRAIDHIELLAASSDPAQRLRNFVLCPGMAYDRSPCGTGSSATVACLAADGELAEGDSITIEGITGESFQVGFRWADVSPDGAEKDSADADGADSEGDRPVIPAVTGRACITARTELIFDPSDPFRFGIGTLVDAGDI